MTWTIYFDDIQEGIWFGSLHPRLADAELAPITGAADENPKLAEVLQYDRPDIILAHEDEPVLVLERTVEVPSGHNVGQRFARLAAAAEARRPLVYFGPYVARKHGGETEGPRWMNLRLFHALSVVSRVHSTAITTINWPVDASYEIVQDPSKDDRVRAYLVAFFEAYDAVGLAGLNEALLASNVHAKQLAEQKAFAQTVKNPGQYDDPPPSVRFLAGSDAASEFGFPELGAHREIVVYAVGMRNIRSDPYTGMAMLYRYLYVVAEPEKDRRLILHFPHVDDAMWDVAAAAVRRKDIRIYRQVADGIIFSRAYRDKQLLVAASGALD
jgi:hypothetical protein